VPWTLGQVSKQSQDSSRTKFPSTRRFEARSYDHIERIKGTEYFQLSITWF